MSALNTVLGPVYAVRGWHIDLDSGSFTAVNHSDGDRYHNDWYDFPHGTASPRGCPDRRNGLWRDHPRVAPSNRVFNDWIRPCTCGFYSMKPEYADELRNATVYGVIKLGGRVVEARKGYRSAQATIVYMLLPDDLRLALIRWIVERCNEHNIPYGWGPTTGWGPNSLLRDFITLKETNNEHWRGDWRVRGRRVSRRRARRSARAAAVRITAARAVADGIASGTLNARGGASGTDEGAGPRVTDRPGMRLTLLQAYFIVATLVGAGANAFVYATGRGDVVNLMAAAFCTAAPSSMFWSLWRIHRGRRS